MIAASVVDLPEPVGPVTSTMPFFSLPTLYSSAGNFSASSVGMPSGMTRRTIAYVPRCEKTFTRKRVFCGIEYERSTDPLVSSVRVSSRSPRSMYIAIISVWYGVSRGRPGKFTGTSWPSISTCGVRPTEKLRSETRSDIFSIASRMASRLKFFMTASSF